MLCTEYLEGCSVSEIELFWGINLRSHGMPSERNSQLALIFSQFFPTRNFNVCMARRNRRRQSQVRVGKMSNQLKRVFRDQSWDASGLLCESQILQRFPPTWKWQGLWWDERESKRCCDGGSLLLQWGALHQSGGRLGGGMFAFGWSVLALNRCCFYLGTHCQHCCSYFKQE